MTNNTYATLWKITGLAAIGLLIVTLILANQARNLPQVGLNGTLTSPNTTIYLREEPYGSSKIVTILERGSEVSVIDTQTNQDINWMKIETGRFTGWVPEANIVFESQ